MDLRITPIKNLEYKKNHFAEMMRHLSASFCGGATFQQVILIRPGFCLISAGSLENHKMKTSEHT
jgi:hypothetical protein